MPNHAQYHTPVVRFADWLVFYVLPRPVMAAGAWCARAALAFVDALGYHVNGLAIHPLVVKCARLPVAVALALAVCLMLAALAVRP
jgi:hypothetical protein